MIRGCCGSTDKPEPLLFIQVYRLLSFYSLVKPPKGSNIDSLELFETLLSEKDVKYNENKNEFKNFLDDIIERGENNKKNLTVRHEHDYNVHNPNDIVVAYFSGFVARKVQNWTSCQECLASVTKCNTNLPREQMINSLSRGYLKYPSDVLFDLLKSLEHAILQTVGQEQLNFYTFQHITKNILAESITFVGCDDHKESLTKTVINYYTIARTKILCKTYNKIYNDARKEEQKLTKLSKLVVRKDPVANNLFKGNSEEKENDSARETVKAGNKRFDRVEAKKSIERNSKQITKRRSLMSVIENSLPSVKQRKISVEKSAVNNCEN